MTRRLSVCYVAPGHKLVATAGSARNILSTAEALSEFADVTLIFREISEVQTSTPYTVREIEPATTTFDNDRDDVSARGLNPIDHLSYLKLLRTFAAESANSYDLIFEKGWRLSGYLSCACLQNGVPAVLIENAVHRWNTPIRSPRTLARYFVHLAANQVASARSRQLPLIIAETEQLKSTLIRHRRVAPEKIEVVGLGVDHRRFFPLPQQKARAELDVPEEVFVMVYVGGMDQYHDLTPILEATGLKCPGNLQLHIVGDGEYRQRYQQYADRSNAEVFFHGQVPNERVPTYISAADVCLAPYDTTGFHGEEVGFSTLKIPEYMACARPVISVPSGNICTLIDNKETGFLFLNSVQEWASFLDQLPTRPQLALMGKKAAARVRGISWNTTAKNYLEVSAQLLR